MSDTPRLLSTAEVARRFQVRPSTVSRWAKTGKLAAVKTPGGSLRFRPGDVDAFLVPTEPATSTYPSSRPRPDVETAEKAPA